MSVRFEWHLTKAARNLRKHNVGFDEATTVFNDPLARVLDDADHSADEERQIIVGHSLWKRLLVVSFTERANEVIRIISARVATRKERQRYENSTFS